MKYEKHACLVLTTDTHEMGYATFQTSILRIKKALQAHTEDSDIHEKKKKKNPHWNSKQNSEPTMSI